MARTPSEYLRKIAAEGGRKGGKASGDCKVRGDSSYYAKLAKRRVRKSGVTVAKPLKFRRVKP